MKLNYNYKDNDGNYAPIVLVIDEMQILNPTEEMYLKAGYHKVELPKPKKLTKKEAAKAERDRRKAELETLITKTDWKITKTSEYRLLGLPDPYDIKALHDEREAYRDEINALESQA